MGNVSLANWVMRTSLTAAVDGSEIGLAPSFLSASTVAGKQRGF
jgi:hypothetical protein